MAHVCLGQIVRLLINSRADVYARDGQGQLPLEVAQGTDKRFGPQVSALLEATMKVRQRSRA